MKFEYKSDHEDKHISEEKKEESKYIYVNDFQVNFFGVGSNFDFEE